MYTDTNYPTLPLPADELEALHENQRGDPITTSEANQRLRDALTDALRNGENSLITAPTSLGKTHTVASTPWRDYPNITGGQPVIHISQTTNARDQAADISQETGVEFHVLRARTEVCPIARGDYDNRLKAPGREKPSEWFDRKCDREGVSFGDAHEHLQNQLGSLPCSRGGLCPAFSQYRDVPRNGNGEPTFDVVHASAAFARLTNIIAGSNVIFDEQPTYRVEIQQDSLRSAITDLLSLRNESSTENYTWESFIELAKGKPESQFGDDFPAWHQQIRPYEKLFKADLAVSERFHQRASIHALAPPIGRAIINAYPAGNGRFCGRDGLVRVVFDEKNNVQVVHDAPDLSNARCVIGLDAHPSPRLWELNTFLDLQQGELLTPQENQYWRTAERGLYVIQIGHYTRPLTTGWKNDSQSTEVKLIIRTLRSKFASKFRTCICPLGLKPEIKELMRKESIEDPKLMHFGGEKSRNDFTDESVGLLVGCIDPGDDDVLNKLALLDLFAEPETVLDDDGNELRAYGRGFIGEDADAADEFLESVRETHVAQSIGRYARNARETGTGAIVYVWTDAIPEGMVDERVPGVKSRVSPKKDRVVEFVFNSDVPVTYKMVVDETGVSKKYVWEVIADMEEQGAARISEGTGENGADEVEVSSETLSPPVDLTIRTE